MTYFFSSEMINLNSIKSGRAGHNSNAALLVALLASSVRFVGGGGLTPLPLVEDDALTGD